INGLAAESEHEQAQAQSAQHQDPKLNEEAKILATKPPEIGNRLAERSERLLATRGLHEERMRELAALQDEMTRAEQALKSRTSVDGRRASFAEAVQVLRKHALQRAVQSSGLSTPATLGDYVKVAPEHQEMVETTLRDELQ